MGGIEGHLRKVFRTYKLIEEVYAYLKEKMLEINHVKAR